LKFQAGRVLPGVAPSHIGRAIELVAHGYERVQVAFEFDSSDSGLMQRIRTVLDSGKINPLAGPGVPLCVLGQTNNQVLVNHRRLVEELSFFRLRLWRDHQIDVLSAKPEQLMLLGFTDAIRLFIKDEPHPVEKIETGRLRLISSCSLVTQICERVLFSDIFEKQVDCWVECPSMVGIGFTDSMTKSVWEIVTKQSNLIQDDVSGWDWSVFQELAMAASNVLERLSHTNDVHHRMMRTAIQCLMNSVFATSGGQMYVLDRPGVMKSGSYVTTLLNSLMRVLLSTMAALEHTPALGNMSFACAVGDDCIEQLCPGESLIERRQFYLKTGVRITDDRKISSAEGFEFCSHLYKDGVASLVSWPRCFFRLLNSEPSQEQLAQFRYELRHNSNLKILEEFALELGWVPPSVEETFGGTEVKQFELRVLGFSDFGSPKLVWEVGPDKTVLEGSMSKNAGKPKPKPVAAAEKSSLQVNSKRSRATTSAIKEIGISHGGGIVAQRHLGSGTQAGGPAEAQKRFFTDLTMPVQEAKMAAWQHTVLDPQTNTPSGVPVMMESANPKTDMYQYSVEGSAVANVNGFCCVALGCDGWVQDPTLAYRAAESTNKFLGYATPGCPVYNTTGAWAFSNVPAYYAAYGATLVGTALPSDFVSGLSASTPYRLVSAELEVWSDAPDGTATGEVMLLRLNNPDAATTTQGFEGKTYSQLTALDPDLVARIELSLANWPNDERARIVALPTNVLPYDLAFPQSAGSAVGTFHATLIAVTSGCASQQVLRWKATYNYEVSELVNYRREDADLPSSGISPGELASSVLGPSSSILGTIAQGSASVLFPPFAVAQSIYNLLHGKRASALGKANRSRNEGRAALGITTGNSGRGSSMVVPLMRRYVSEKRAIVGPRLDDYLAKGFKLAAEYGPKLAPIMMQLLAAL